MITPFPKGTPVECDGNRSRGRVTHSVQLTPEDIRYGVELADGTHVMDRRHQDITELDDAGFIFDEPATTG